ncbi:MAG: tetratricopeptide repeat protein [Acidimicrobiia bacterium]|nr:tetratricopeptide repeat protein [Acidimicrobiia bacterium]
MMRRFPTNPALLLIASTIVGCARGPHGPYTTPASTERSPLMAERLTQDAIAELSSDREAAEELLRRALTADLFYGPAHNNLGVLYLEQGLLYEAANEFEWSRKLMPGHPDPRLNLAITLERAGRIDDALASYEAAVEVSPDYMPALQGLVRCQIKHQHVDKRTVEMLKRIALRGNTDQWRDWSREQLVRLEP